MSEVYLKHIYKVYEGGVRAVNDFSLDIKDKEFIVFVGPSGCGKSTTLRMIAGLENITSGELFIDGALVNDKDSKDRDIAMVFQSYALYPHMTVFQNLAFGLKLRHLDPKEIEARVNKAAEILEITDLLTRKPKALSGGQRQRVALGRAIVREPKVFLLDEPLSNLDAKLRVQMRMEITKLHKRLATTFIYVTHDQTEAMTMGDRIVVMNKGYVQQVDTPVNLYENPANLFVATFLGSPQMNILNCSLRSEKDELVAYINDKESLRTPFPSLKAKELSDSSYIGKKMLLGIRPEHIEVASKGIPGEIDAIEQLGDETILYVKIEGQDNDILSKGTASGKFKVKQKIFLHFKMEDAHLFDPESTNSVMDLPRLNRIEASLGDRSASIGKTSFVFDEDYASHILPRAREIEKTFLCFSPKSISFEEMPESLKIPAKVDFLVRKTDSTTVFLTSKGIKKYLVTSVSVDSSIKEGDELSLYIKNKDIWFEDEEGNELISKEKVLPNIVKASIRKEGDKSLVRFGNSKVLVDELKVSDGEHMIEISQSLVDIVLSKKDSKKTGRKNPEYDHDAILSASAYDEDQLGKYNAVFVKVSGFNDYATFLTPADFSVYKAPEFAIALRKGAIKVIS